MERYLIIPNDLSMRGFAVVHELGKYYIEENGSRRLSGFWKYEEAISEIRRSLK